MARRRVLFTITSERLLRFAAILLKNWSASEAVSSFSFFRPMPGLIQFSAWPRYWATVSSSSFRSSSQSVTHCLTV